MLFFLRKIRKKLISENKLTTYLLYAIGEILLVVVGILIAVKIDSLNQENQEKIKQRQYYEGIIIDLRRDSIHFTSLEEAFEQHLESYYLVYYGIKNTISTIQARDVEMMMYNRTFAPVTQKNHQSTIDKITNNEVRALLNDYFGSQELAKEAINEFNKTIVEESRPHVMEMNVFNYDLVFHGDTLGFLPSTSLIKDERIADLLKEERTLQVLSFLRISAGLVVGRLERLKARNTELIGRLEKFSKTSQ